MTSTPEKKVARRKRMTSYPATAAFIILTLVAILLVHKVETDEMNFKQEVHTRTLNDCLQRQDAREITTNIFNFLLGLAPDPTSPAVASVRQYIATNLPPVSCDEQQVIVTPATSAPSQDATSTTIGNPEG